MTRREYALEIRRHWAEELLSGRKKVELRGYPLPEAVGEIAIEFFFSQLSLLSSLSPFSSQKPFSTPNKLKGSSRVWLLATDGAAGQAALGDALDPLRDRERAEIVGWARFDKGKEKIYQSAAEVEADGDEHLVRKSAPSSSDSRGSSSSSVYGWREGVTEALFGWRVAEVRRAERGGGKPLPELRGKRLLRSVYVLEGE